MTSETANACAPRAAATFPRSTPGNQFKNALRLGLGFQQCLETVALA
jgi:hypothetical protein